MTAQVLVSLLPSLPLFLGAAVGIAVAAVRFRRHPPVSGLVIGGLVLVTMPTLIAIPVQFALATGSGPSRFELIGVVNLVSFLLNAAGLGLLVVAALGWRTSPAAPLPAADRDAQWRLPD